MMLRGVAQGGHKLGGGERSAEVVFSGFVSTVVK